MGSVEHEYPTRIAIEDEEGDAINAFSITAHRNRCCCFNLPSSSSTAAFWDKLRAADSNNQWWALPYRAIKKLRDWSEIVAGPKWKTFIRRFNRHRNHRHQHPKFQYDPLSYALNFDEGPGQIGHFDEDCSAAEFPDFSSRFAAVKTSVDFGTGRATPVIG